jgi:hypothetical protein
MLIALDTGLRRYDGGMIGRMRLFCCTGLCYQASMFPSQPLSRNDLT